ERGIDRFGNAAQAPQQPPQRNMPGRKLCHRGACTLPVSLLPPLRTGTIGRTRVGAAAGLGAAVAAGFAAGAASGTSGATASASVHSPPSPAGPCSGARVPATAAGAAQSRHSVSRAGTWREAVMAAILGERAKPGAATHYSVDAA